MQAIDIDFVQPHKTWSPVWPLIACVLILIAGLLCWQHYWRLTHEVEQQQRKLDTLSPPVIMKLRPEIDESIALSHQLENQLNHDWLGLFSTLETVQQENPTLKLIHMKPDPSRKQLSLTGLAKRFETITNTIETLETKSLFNDVALKSQYSSIEQPGYIQFQLVMEWQP